MLHILKYTVATEYNADPKQIVDVPKEPDASRYRMVAKVELLATMLTVTVQSRMLLISE